MNRIQSILLENWAIAPDDYNRLLSLFIPAYQTGQVAAVETFLSKCKVKAYASSIPMVSRYELNSKELPDNSVAVIELSGALYSWETFRIQQMIQQANDNPQIAGTVLWINGPGGMITALDSTADLIYASKKPVAAYIAGNCCSAHYWIASATGKRFLGSKLCVVGSIGVFGSYYSDKEYYKKLGIDFRDIYPDSSDLKNKEVREIEKNNNEKPYKEHLASIHKIFSEAVAKNLGISFDSSSPIFRGANFMGDEAISNKLADCYGTLDDAAKWVLSQSEIARFNQMTRI